MIAARTLVALLAAASFALPAFAQEPNFFDVPQAQPAAKQPRKKKAHRSTAVEKPVAKRKTKKKRPGKQRRLAAPAVAPAPADAAPATAPLAEPDEGLAELPDTKRGVVVSKPAVPPATELAPAPAPAPSAAELPAAPTAPSEADLPAPPLPPVPQPAASAGAAAPEASAAPAAPALDFDLLSTPGPAPTPFADPELQQKLGQRRALLTLHQGVGIALVGLMAGTMVSGQLNYLDKFGGSGTDRYKTPHTVLAGATLGTFAAAGLLAYLAPVPVPRERNGIDRVMVHEGGMIGATAGMAAEATLGILTASREGYANQGTLAGTHLAIGYLTLAFMTVAVGALVF